MRAATKRRPRSRNRWLCAAPCMRRRTSLLSEGRLQVPDARKWVRLVRSKAPPSTCLEDSVPTYNASNAECLVFTYKDGLLSAVAHDLKIRVTDFSLTVDEAQDEVSGTFNAGSLRVVNAMSSGTDTPGTPGE